MPYADLEYYNNSFLGDKIITDETELNRYLILASKKIDKVTFNRIVGNFEKLTQFQQKNIKDAVCYQANYFKENGIDVSSNIFSYSVLDISLTIDNKSEAFKQNMSQTAYDLLNETNLMNRMLL